MPPTSRAQQQSELRASRRRVYRRRRVVAILAAVVVISLGVYLPLTLLAPLKAAASTIAAFPTPATTSPKIDMPSYGESAITALGYGGELATGGNTKPMPMASISKIITTLVVLQKKPLSLGQNGPSITFTSADAAYLQAYAAQDGDVYPIRVGGSLTEKQVITIALVPSANNYARALADWAYGSEAKFVPVAQAWLKANGMTSTTMVEPTGINPENTSTAHDLLTLGKLALANPVVAQITRIKQATLPVVGTIKNTNSLLGVEGIDGIKTGTLNSAGSSLLFTSHITVGGVPITLVGVILDGPTHPIIDSQIRLIVRQAIKGFQVVTLVTKGARMGDYSTVWGQTASAVAATSASMVVWGGTAVHEQTTIRPVTLAKAGSSAGTATFTVSGANSNGQTVTVPLTLSKTISDPGPAWRLTHPGQ